MTERVRRLAALALVALVASALPTARAAAPEPRGVPMPLVASSFTMLGAHSPDQALANLAAAGVRDIRQDFLWARIEPVRGRYDFGFEDRLVAAAARHGVEVVAILAYGNPVYSTVGGALTASGTGGGLPPFGLGAAYLVPPDPGHLDAYRRFARAVASHFRGRVHRYEVWNEENEGWRFWPPHEDAAAYARLLRAGAEGLHAGDPDALVSSGGVFWPEVPPGLPGEGGLRFLGHLHDADPRIGGALDAIAWHPYPYPFVAPEVEIPANSSVPGSARQLRALLAARGDTGKQLWVTEIGWPTHREYGVTEQRQAAYLTRSLAELWAEGARLYVWYTYADGPNAAHDQEDAFGLFRFDGTPKPAYRSLRTFTRTLGAARLVGGTAGALSFERPDGARVTMLWTSRETTTTDYGALPATDDRRRIALPASRAVRVVSMTGDERLVRPVAGTVTIEISPFPVYVVEPAR